MHKITGLKEHLSNIADMKVGELAIVIDSPSVSTYSGLVIARMFSYNGAEYVAINDPSKTWSGTPDFRVRILKPGETFTVTVGKVEVE